MKNRKILVLIDIQNDFIDGALKNDDAQKAIPNIVDKILHGDYTEIIATYDSHRMDDSGKWGVGYNDSLEGQLLPVPHCIEGSDGWEMNDEVMSAIRTMQNKGVKFTPILKPTFGSILSLPKTVRGDWAFTENILLLDDAGVYSVDICGFCTDICVVSNALILRATLPNVPITVDARCCAGVTPEKHKAALEVMKSCMIDIINEK